MGTKNINGDLNVNGVIKKNGVPISGGGMQIVELEFDPDEGEITLTQEQYNTLQSDNAIIKDTFANANDLYYKSYTDTNGIMYFYCYRYGSASRADNFIVRRINVYSYDGTYYAEELLGNSFMTMIHPIGSIYISVTQVSPASLFGGTWTSLGIHYLAKGDIPVVPTNNDIDLTSNPNSMKIVRAGSNLSDDGYLLGSYNGYLCSSSNTAGTARYGIVPTNLWAKNTDSSYGTAVYVWQRIS